VNKYHLEVVGESSEHRSVGFEVNISNGNRAVAEEAELPLHVELLQEQDAVAGRVHGVPASRARRSPHRERNPENPGAPDASHGGCPPPNRDGLPVS